MNNTLKFKSYYQTTKKEIDKKISQFNKDLIKDDNSMIQRNLKLFSNLNSGGKIVRGTLVNLGYYLLKDNNEYANDLSLAYEIFQTAILVHDDIIDNDDKRRGKNTIHYDNYKTYKKYGEDSKHFASSIAICVGDYGLYKANQIIINNYANDKNLAKVLDNFNNTVLTTIRGELIDVCLPFHSKNNLLKNKDIEDNVMEIYRLKTAHYTIIGPLSVGIILAGGNKSMLDDIEKFGEKVGIAFQIQDDILGIYSDETNKVKGSDIKEFKQTILYSHIINTEYKDKIMKYYGKNNINEKNIKEVQKIFKESKSYDYAINTMNTMYDEAIKILDDIKWIKEDKKDILKGFVEYLRTRNK